MWSNFKMVFKELVYEGLDWSHVAQNMNEKRAPVNIVTNCKVP
jgi:hypothetical protein